MKLDMPNKLFAGYFVLALAWLSTSLWIPYTHSAEVKIYVTAIGYFTFSCFYLFFAISKLQQSSKQTKKEIAKLGIALDAGHESVWEWQLDNGRTDIYFSPSYCRMLGYAPDKFAKQQSEWQNFLHPDERERIYKKVMRFLADRASSNYENTYRMLHSDGEFRWIHSRGRIIFDNHGQPQSLIGMATDISEKRQDHDRLLQANAVFEATHEGVLISDHNNSIVFVNPAFSLITGYETEEVLGKNPRIFKSGRHTKEFYNEMWRSLEEHSVWSGEIWNRRKNGEILPQLQSIRLIRDENDFVTYSVAIFSDISLLKRSQSELSFLAHYDPLTNLSNRLLLHEHIKLSLRRAIHSKTEAALFIVDLDHFKNINESLGHSLGDELLKATAERLSQFMENNATLSRFGGDEFAVVFDNVQSAASSATLAQQILTLFDAPYVIGGNEIFITASIGICLFPLSGKTSEEIFRNADTALSKAKAIGRATFAFYTSELTDQAYQRLRIASELRYALENDQLRVFFQPVYSLTQERIIGCEALVRWMHPERGMISPADFIPIAEDSGLISNIDSWVLNTSCLQMKAWLDAGLDLKFVAVNVSSRLFSRIDFTEKVVEALAESQLDPRFLELEITESAVMDDVERADSLLNKLCDMSVRLALDDFGTGYSSLNRLKSLPVHKLKIDQSFVRHLPTDGSDAAIVRAIIALGFSMQLEIQAEGIETIEQAEFLRQSNCVLAQGYFFGRPMPADEFLQLITAPLSIP